MNVSNSVDLSNQMKIVKWSDPRTGENHSVSFLEYEKANDYASSVANAFDNIQVNIFDVARDKVIVSFLSLK